MNNNTDKVRAKVKAALSNSVAVDQRGYALDRAPDLCKLVDSRIVADVLDEVLYALDSNDQAVSAKYRAARGAVDLLA